MKFSAFQKTVSDRTACRTPNQNRLYLLVRRSGKSLCIASKIGIHLGKRLFVKVVNKTQTNKLHHCRNGKEDCDQRTEIDRKLPRKLGNVDVFRPCLGVNRIVDVSHPLHDDQCNSGTYPNREIGSMTGNNLAANTNVSDIYSYKGDAGTLQLWIAEGYIADLNDIVNTQIDRVGNVVSVGGETVLERMTGNAAKAVVAGAEKHIYGIPEYISVTGFAYNKDLFNQYGWEIPDTTAELEALCQQIIKDTKGEIDPIGWFQDAGGYLYFATENWVNQYEGIANLDAFYNSTDRNIYHNENGMFVNSKTEALSNLFKFFLPRSEGGYSANTSRTVGYKAAQRNLLKGEFAMMLNGSWLQNEMLQYWDEAEIGMFAIPQLSDSDGSILQSATYDNGEVGNDKRVLNASYDAYYMIPERAINKQGAIDFLLYLSSEEGCELYTQYSNAVRPFKYDVSTTSALYSKVSNFGRSILDIADQCYLYTPIINNEWSALGLGGLWSTASPDRIEVQAIRKGASKNPADWLAREWAQSSRYENIA